MVYDQDIDILACTNGTVWLTDNKNEHKDLAKEFGEHVTINYAEFSRLEDKLTLGGPTGVWCVSEFDREKQRLKSWRGAKYFTNCELQWFFEGNYFNAKGNVYSNSAIEPFFNLRWENCQILQFTAGVADGHYLGILLDNGQVWVANNYNHFNETDFPKNNGWVHLPFYDDKNVKSILAMNSIVYILCENPKQTLFYHSYYFPYRYLYGDNETNTLNPNIPTEDNTMNSKTIIKMVSLPYIVLCWCEEGLYAWFVSGEVETIDHPIYQKHSQFYPYNYFKNKQILDIGASLHFFYILCDDGIYTIPSTVEADDEQIIPIKLPLFDENFPVIFSSYLASKQSRIKSATK